MPTQRVLVTVMERHFDATVTAMRAAGMTNVREYEELGVVAGEIVNPDALVGIPGVMGWSPHARCRLPARSGGQTAADERQAAESR